jgi:hypothetical protein
VRLARRPPLLPLDELLSRVAELEKRLGGTPPSGPAPRGSGSPVRGGTPAPASAPSSTEPAARTRGSLALAQGAPRVGSFPEPRLSERALDAPRPVLVPVPSPSAALDPRVWCGLVELLRASDPPLASLFEHALPVEVGPERVVLTFEAAPFLVERASAPEALRALTEVVRRHFGAPTRVTIDTAAKAACGVRTVATIESERRESELARARAAVEDHPMVREAVRVFGAQVRDVKLPSGDG